LVGAPLEKLLRSSGYDVTVVERKTPEIAVAIASADVIVTATGVPGLVESRMIKERAVVVDAGVAGEQGKTVGDLADDVYDRDDLTITPRKGGVGPLTVCALFDNVIRAARAASAE
jgi:methylenetetrahydrofolate dehydrogenase (NADP+)/methenyltetrahydrofolate cyclohydrolase